MAGPGDAGPAGLPVLPADGFEARLQDLGPTVVAFTADWCGYCLRFAPAFQQAASRRTGPGLAFAVADISDDDADPRWDAYGIAVVPSVVYFDRGRPAARLDGVAGRGIAPAQLQAFLDRLPR